jgi:hypothetical protein
MSNADIERVVAVIGAAPGPVEVLGDGPFARALRARLGAGAPAGDARPAVVVETSGDPAAIGAALARVDDLGTVVLAGPAAVAEPVALDLYADLHVRGLTLVGVPVNAATHAS